MKGCITKKSLLCMFLLTVSGLSQATLITDNYIGSDNHGYGDVIGSESTFGVDSLEFSRVGNILSVTINTGFAGKGGDGLFADYTLDDRGIGYGDLFISTSWNPDGAAPYLSDNATTGTVWEYGFSLDNRWMSGNGDGAGSTL